MTRKMDAYHRDVQLGCILQGLMMHLAVNFRSTVWASFGSWLRTMRPDLVPSELVVAQALRSGFPDFLLDTDAEPEITKFIRARMDVERAPGLLATG